MVRVMARVRVKLKGRVLIFPSEPSSVKGSHVIVE